MWVLVIEMNIETLSPAQVGFINTRSFRIYYHSIQFGTTYVFL